MALKLLGYSGLPPHKGQGGFDHAALHIRLGLLYVAHTANDTLDVIDCRNDSYLRSIPNMIGVAREPWYLKSPISSSLRTGARTR